MSGLDVHEALANRIRAARTLLCDGSLDPACAGLHVARAWAEVSGGIELAAWFENADPKLLRRGQKTVRDAERLQGGSELTAAPVSRGILRRSLRDLEYFLTHSQRDVRTVWKRRIVFLLFGTVFVLAALHHFRRAPATPWHAEYFANEDLEGEPVVVQESAVEHDWNRKRPHPRIPGDGFTVRWHSCLPVKEAVAAAFQIMADDGFRMYVGDSLIIDHWDRLGTAGGEIELGPGLHDLRVELREQTGKARIMLLGSIDGKPPRLIDPSFLQPPSAGGESCKADH